jgi:hypothetical protein
MAKIPDAEELKTWTTSRLIGTIAQLVTIDITRKGKIVEFDDANPERIEAFYKALNDEINARIPARA